MLCVTPVVAYGGVGGGMIFLPINNEHKYDLVNNVFGVINNSVKLPITYAIKKIKLKFKNNETSEVEITIFKTKNNKMFREQQMLYSGMLKSQTMEEAQTTLNIDTLKYRNIKAYTSDNYKSWEVTEIKEHTFTTQKYFIIVGDTI